MYGAFLEHADLYYIELFWFSSRKIKQRLLGYLLEGSLSLLFACNIGK